MVCQYLLIESNLQQSIIHAETVFKTRERVVNDPQFFANKRAHSENMLFRSTIIEIDRYDGVLLLNEHDDLYFLFHNFDVHIIPLKTFFF